MQNHTSGYIKVAIRLYIIVITIVSNTAFAGNYELVTVQSQSKKYSAVVELPKISIDNTEIALIVNTQDPLSIEIAQYYQEKRKIPIENVITISLDPSSNDTTAQNALEIRQHLNKVLPSNIQAMVFAFSAPSRVDNCVSLTTAISLGVTTCGTTVESPLYNTSTKKPFSDYGIRPSMMLAGASFQNVKSLIDRSVAADATFPHGDGYVIKTTDSTRSGLLFNLASNFQQFVDYWNRTNGLSYKFYNNESYSSRNNLLHQENVLFYFLGIPIVDNLKTNTFLPGALGFHATSYGGRLFDSSQMSILRWLEAGVSASFGTVQEPYSNPIKFPRINLLVESYFSGQNALQAYWSSVHGVTEGLFVGDPLTRPYGPAQVTLDNDGVLTINTTSLAPNVRYQLLGANSKEGPYQIIQDEIFVTQYGFKTIISGSKTYAHYRLTEKRDITKPIVSFKSPYNNTIVIGLFTISAEAFDDVAIANLTILLDGVVVANSSSNRISLQLDSRTLRSGERLLKAIAIDSDGNTQTIEMPFKVADQGQSIKVCGDYDSDGDVDTYDLNQHLSFWSGINSESTISGTKVIGDCDGDRDSDSADLLIFLENWTGVK